MSVGLEPTTVVAAAPWMARALGIAWPGDRCEVVDYINRYRNLLYNSYSELQLFNNTFHCMAVSTFPQQCANPCSLAAQTYQGFTLPPDVSALEAAWEYGEPLKTRSRWREMHTGIGNQSRPRVDVIEMAETFPTERALKQLIPLMLFAESIEDEGKVVTIDAVDAKGVARCIKFTLRGEAWVKGTFSVAHIVSVALPSDLHGSVSLAQQDGYVLSTYVPGEIVPDYRRFRVASSCVASSIFIQGVKRFTRVHFDHDIVEVGDQLVIEAAGSFFKFRENTTDRKERERSEADRAEIGVQLMGVVARNRGNAIQDGPALTGRRTSRRRILPQYRLR